MKTLLISLSAAAFLSGCAVVKVAPPRSKKADVHGCKPSQYWDGKQCKHKGKVSGARKHDG